MSLPFRDTWLIHEGLFWNVILHDNQSYLGRCIVYLKSRELDDVLLVSHHEREELWDLVLPRLQRGLAKAFNPDRLNYSHLANSDHFVHWHVVPRYENNPTRVFAGHRFVEERAGRHYAPEPELGLSKEVMEQIQTALLERF